MDAVAPTVEDLAFKAQASIEFLLFAVHDVVKPTIA